MNRDKMNGKPVFTVPAKTAINFKSYFDKKLLCDGITFTAGSACVYSCSFCYVEDMMRKQQAWNAAHGVTGNHFSHVIRRENAVEIARKQIMSKPEAFRMAKKVIYASPSVDVAANMDLVRETVEICKVILSCTNWDIRLLSKSNLLPQIARALETWFQCSKEPFMSFIGEPKNRIIYGVSTGTLDDDLAAAFEQGTAKVSKRIESIRWLQDNGYRTFGMICPSLPQDDYGKFSIDMAKALRIEKMEHVWAEVINVRGASFDRTLNALRDSGFEFEAAMVRRVSACKQEWESYARSTFQMHSAVIPPSKLRFLQYVTKDTAPWWKEREPYGAVLL